jgi:malonate transporter and related proteins
MQVIIALFPLIVLITMGYVLKRSQFLQPEFWRGAEQLNYFILFPILLFIHLGFVELNVSKIQSVVLATLSSIFIISLVLWILHIVFGIPARRFGVYVQSQIRFNTYIGLSLMAALFGAAGLQSFAMMMLVAIPTVNVISVWAFSQGQGLSIFKIIKTVLKNPLILGCIVGLIFNLLDIEIFAGLYDLMKLLGNTSLPLGLLCVGAGLQFTALRKSLLRLSLNTLARLLIVPLTAYTVCHLYGLNPLSTMIVTIFFALPTATAGYILTKILHGDSELMAGIISLQTLCFAFSFPLLMWVLF